MASNNVLAIADGSLDIWQKEYEGNHLFPKLLVTDIKAKFDQDWKRELRQVYTESVKVNPYKGASTIVMAKFDPERPNFLNTMTSGDSGYLII